mmetsp:Transcript_20779/g.43779  ORF Transcript_20779/g.43779 Transcript_20779/m.43779 type:complete len:84 (+) Transcript_20779:302-553(+)
MASPAAAVGEREMNPPFLRGILAFIVPSAVLHTISQMVPPPGDVQDVTLSTLPHLGNVNGVRYFRRESIEFKNGNKLGGGHLS